MNETEMREREALVALERWCSTAEHCCSEARRKLEPFGLDASSAERILARLTGDGYIDEDRYAAAFVHDKVNFAKWGRRKISYSLRQKQVAEQSILKAMDGIDEEQYRSMMESVVRSSYRTQKGKTPYERSMKTLRSVAGRGFEPQLIGEVLRQITGEDLDPQD